MTVVAAIRPDDWNFPLFLHVLGAFTLIGALAMAASFLFQARRGGGSVALIRFGYRSLLWAALPAFIVTRITAQWLADKEGLEDAELAWIDLGYISTDVGLLFLLGSTIAAGLAVRRAGDAETSGRSAGGAAVAAWLVTFLIVVYAVVIWAMATKPD